MNTPSKPWLQGKQPGYTAFRMVVEVCQDTHGNVWSDHDYATVEDEQIAQSLQHGGVLQVAHAFMTIAVCREVFTTTLVKLSQDPTFLSQWSSMTAEERLKVERDLATASLQAFTQTAAKMIPGAVPGVLSMLSGQETDRPAQE